MQNFTYINDYMAGEGVLLEQNAVVGCECTNCVKEKSSCCGRNAGSEFAYYTKKTVRLPPGMPIYECNSKCSCGPDCPNRVVQQGRKHRVCVFRTANNRGWGVKAMQRIRKGSFIMEYVGEVCELVSFMAVKRQIESSELRETGFITQVATARKTGKVGEFHIGQGKVREIWNSRGNFGLPVMCCRSCDRPKINIT